MKRVSCATRGFIARYPSVTGVKSVKLQRLVPFLYSSPFTDEREVFEVWWRH